MQFRECDDGEGAERNCYRRLQWSERLDLIHVAMLLFSRVGRCPACCRGAAAPWLDLGGASSGSVVKKIFRVGGWSPPNSGKRWRRAGCPCQRTRGRVLWCGGRRRSAGGYHSHMGSLSLSGGVRRRRGPESCPRARRVSPAAGGRRLSGAGKSMGGNDGWMCGVGARPGGPVTRIADRRNRLGPGRVGRSGTHLSPQS